MKTLFALLVATAGLACAQNQDSEVHVWPVQGNIYMIVGAGGNITVQTGKDGVLVVDTGLAPMADKVLAAIKSISNGPIRYIINTHYHADHTGGNEKIRLAGSTIVGANVTGDIKDAGVGAAILSHINVLNRMSAPTGNAGPVSLGRLAHRHVPERSEEAVLQRRRHRHPASARGPYRWRQHRVLPPRRCDQHRRHLHHHQLPDHRSRRGGSIQGIIDALQKIVDLIIPVYGQEGGTMVVPGHGRLCDFGDVLNFREMTIIIRDRIQDMIKKGMTLEQVKAARPTQDYDPLYGSTTGFWTTDKFVEAVYKSLKGEK